MRTLWWFDFARPTSTPYYAGQVVTLRRPVLPAVSIGRSIGDRPSRETWGDWKGLYDVSTRKNLGESDPPSKKWIDPSLVRVILSRLISGATAIVVEWISKGGRL